MSAAPDLDLDTDARPEDASQDDADRPMLDIDAIDVYYGPVQALRGVTLHVDPGEMVALLGPNGAGKTTTLRAASGMRNPKRGSIRIDGQDISQLPAHQVVGLGVAHMPQGRELFADLTVEENLRLGHWSRRDEKDLLDERMDRMFELFPRLAERRKQAAGTMSGGEQQMLTVSRALMSEPKVLLVDEASLGLAPMLVEQLYEAIAEVNRRDGTSVLLVDQFIHLALKYTSRAYVLEKGEVVLDGHSDELLESPEVLAAYLGESMTDQPTNGEASATSAREAIAEQETDEPSSEPDESSEEPTMSDEVQATEAARSEDTQAVSDTERFVATNGVDDILDAVAAGRFDAEDVLAAEEAGTSRITLLRPMRAVIDERDEQDDRS